MKDLFWMTIVIGCVLSMVMPAHARSMPELTGLVEQLKPTVVNTHTTKKVQGAHGGLSHNPY
ncbi:hypothetical protein [Magnetococcus marinus]|uniref:hypothetical protein n=1 Tax=Magnetococcus marinus TaxID=1124597 RepID=UPI0005A1AA41|nr:hypothetical protein [Magnetococcus marinus]